MTFKQWTLCAAVITSLGLAIGCGREEAPRSAASGTHTEGDGHDHKEGDGHAHQEGDGHNHDKPATVGQPNQGTQP